PSRLKTLRSVEGARRYLRSCDKGMIIGKLVASFDAEKRFSVPWGDLYLGGFLSYYRGSNAL
ncbi:MAG: hypothetical protein QOH31_1379, partial [Verrucomicrobiota bacterium]